MMNIHSITPEDAIFVSPCCRRRQSRDHSRDGLVNSDACVRRYAAVVAFGRATHGVDQCVVVGLLGGVLGGWHRLRCTAAFHDWRLSVVAADTGPGWNVSRLWS